jgi:cation diffusion facilitator family transporter
MDTNDVTKQESRFSVLRRVTLIGSLVNITVASAQIAGGILAHSQALVADGLHTLSDLASDAVVLFAAKHGSQDADEAHPYGHRRIETLGSVVVGLALMAVAVGIAIEAFRHLLQPGQITGPAPVALAFAALAIVAKESLYHYTMHVAKRVKSNLLKANAWHHRSDVFSSLVVFAGIGGALLGFVHLDAIAAIAVSVMILRIGWKLATSGVSELIDTGLEPEELDAIRDSILKIDGVKNLHTLRTRRMGGEALADVHIQVNPRVSVSEGHHIGEAVRDHLIKHFEQIADVTVHVDPEDDSR